MAQTNKFDGQYKGHTYTYLCKNNLVVYTGWVYVQDAEK